MQNLREEKLAPAINSLWKVANLYKERIDGYEKVLLSTKNLSDELVQNLEDNIHTMDLQASKLTEFEAKIKSLEEIIAKQRLELTTLSSDFAASKDYQEKHGNLLVEFDSYKSNLETKNAEINSELNSKFKELETTQSDYSFLQKELNRFKLELIEKDDSILKHKESIAELQNRVFQSKDTEKRAAVFAENNQHLEETVSDLTNQRNSLQAKLNETKINTGEQQNNNEKLTFYKEELEKQAELIRTFNNKNAQFQQEKAELQAKIAHIESDYVNTSLLRIESLETELAKAKLEIENKERLTDDANLKVKQFGAVAIASQTSMEQLTNKIKDFEHKLQLAKKEQSEMLYKIEQEQTKANKFKETIGRLEENLIVKSKELGELERANADLKLTSQAAANNSNDSDEAKLDIALLTEEISNLESALAEAMKKDDFEKLVLENEDLRNTLNSAKQDFENQKKMLVDLVQNKDSMIAENKALNELYQLKNTQLVSALMEKERKIEEFTLLSKESSGTLNLSEIKLLQNNISNLTTKIESRDKSIGNMQTKINELESLIKVRYDQIEILEKQLNTQVGQRLKEKELKEELANKFEAYISKIEGMLG